MALSYTYSISNDFIAQPIGNRIVLPQKLHYDINAEPGITSVVKDVVVNGDLCVITFLTDLPLAEEPILLNIIQLHNPQLILYKKQYFNVTVNGIVTTSSTVDVLIPGMSITPGIGVYLAVFNSAINDPADNNRPDVFYSIYANNIKLFEAIITADKIRYKLLNMHTIVNITDDTQIVECKLRLSLAVPMSIQSRSFTLVRL